MSGGLTIILKLNLAEVAKKLKQTLTKTNKINNMLIGRLGEMEKSSLIRGRLGRENSQGGGPTFPRRRIDPQQGRGLRGAGRGVFLLLSSSS